MKEICSYYSPCGEAHCQECNDTRGVHSSVLPNAFSVLDRLRRYDLVQPQGIRSPSGGGELKAEVDSLLKSLSFETADEQGTGNHTRVPGFSGEFLGSSKRAREETHGRSPLRRVIEVKQKRRKAIREIKRECTIPHDLPREGSVKDANSLLTEDDTNEEPSNRSVNKFDVLSEETDMDCRFSGKLRKKAEALVRLFSNELGLDGRKEKLGMVRCGGLRSAVRNCFPANLSVLHELSLKTSQKVEKSCCKFCEPEFDKKMDEWKWRLSEEVEVSDDHLERYRHAFRGNVPVGWNDRKYPYIPNGGATKDHQVALGGNWNKEEFSEECRPVGVFSSGKYRIVTCYSAYNSEVLSPIHHSLYSYLARRGWLLKGEPTQERIGALNGTGDYLSFDYIGATDNIKVEYVRAGIEILIERAVGMTPDEERCLRVLGDLQLWEMCVARNDNGAPMNGFRRGQPMGSFMSFPLLCLTNKSIVDLSLTDLLESRQLTFEEWSQHKCLINGDDLLLREPRKDSNLRDRIIYNGKQVGMETNKEKCLKADDKAEINSTLFVAGEKKKKTNARALYMEPDVEDVLGLAYEATGTREGFIQCVHANIGTLKKQKDKFLWKLPRFYQGICRKNKKIKKALFCAPVSERPPPENFLPVREKPDGYDLLPEEERRLISEKVSMMRERVVSRRISQLIDEQRRKDENEKRKERGEDLIPKKSKISVGPAVTSWRKLLKKKKTKEREMTLSFLADYFEEEKKDLMIESEIGTSDLVRKTTGCSMIAQLIGSLQEFKGKNSLVSNPTTHPKQQFTLTHTEVIKRVDSGFFVFSRQHQVLPKYEEAGA